MPRKPARCSRSLSFIMKTVSIVCVSFMGLIVVCSAATDYCSPSLCKKGKHIGCRNNGAFKPACPKGKTYMVKMTEELKAKIVDSHNSKRNTLASGKLPRYKSAERMATMQWDNELATLAALNVKTCTFGHDQCRNTKKYKYSGQNLGKYGWTGSGINDEKVILRLIDNWWNEHKDASQSDVDRYPTRTSKKIGHFTVMTAEKNVALGCAVIKFPEGEFSIWTLACNYAWTNILGAPLYKSGKTASKCQSGTNPKYKGLCSPSEKIFK